MKDKYRHTQRGMLILTALGGAVLFTTILSLIKGHKLNLFDYIVLTILGMAAVLFSSLTVVIKGNLLQIRFGPGLIRKTFSLKDINSCKIVKNPWYYGWGIRKIPRGWLYNVSGLMAVELQMKNGKKYRIGTDVPEELYKAIQCSLQNYKA